MLDWKEGLIPCQRTLYITLFSNVLVEAEAEDIKFLDGPKLGRTDYVEDY